MSIYDKSSLVLIPSGTKTSKVYSQKPVSGDGDFTFTRSSAATRVNADGNIEKETQNLLLQSNSFDTTWAAGGGTLTSGQTGYDGSSDAWLFTMSSGANICNQSNTNGGVQTYSVYAKGSASNGIRLYAFGSTNVNVFFNLNTGAVAAESNNIDASIEDVGSGWYRCSMTYNSTNTNLYLYLTNNSNGNAASGSVYIQDAQLEQGLVARDVITTTTTAVEGGITDDVPRLDYTDSSCPALLLEPQRTNKIDNSEFINNDSSWVEENGADCTPNYAESPEGVDNATRVQLDNSGSNILTRIFHGFSPDSSNDTASFYAKSNTGSSFDIVIYFRDVGFGSVRGSKTITLTNEWQRFDLTADCSGATGNVMFLIYNTTASENWDFLMYGSQVEAGSYATSYIPTYGTSVTRNGEICNKTSISDLIGQTEGAFFTEFKIENLENLATRRLLTLSNGNSNTRIVIYLNSLNKISIYIVDGGVAQWDYTGTILTAGTYKIAVGYAANDFVLYVNGSLEATDSAGSVPATNRIDIGNQLGSNIGEQPLKQLSVFKTRLTNAELADLTTL